MEKNRCCNTLLDCPARFAGLYGRQYIKQFTEFIQAYKKIKRISDEQALEELIHLLTNHAYNWWRRRQRLFKTWSEALAALTQQFGKRRPAYLIYAELFHCNQQSFDNEKKILDFINDKIELLHELSEQELNDTIEAKHFDMIWALLPPEKRTHYEYLHINSISDLMEYLNENIKIKRKYPNDNRDKEHLTQPHNDNESNNNSNKTCPTIKVKRTADLMPIISSTTKQMGEDNGNVNVNVNEHANGNENADGNTIVITTTTTTSTTKTNDKQTLTMPTSTPMTQANPIVIDDRYDVDVNDYNDDDDNDNDDDDVDFHEIDDDNDDGDDGDDVSIDASPKMPQITYLLNGETTIAPELPTISIQKSTSHKSSKHNQHQQQQTQEEFNNKEKKIKLRCGFCHNFGHRSVACMKKMKYMHLYPERFKANGSKCNKLSKPNKTIKTALQFNKDFILNDNVIVSTISNKIPANTSISLQQVNTQKNGHNCTSNNNSSSSSNNNSNSNNNNNDFNITIRKLMKPINGTQQSSSKNNVKIIYPKNNTDNRNNTNSNSKCHQCGTVGYYRSICPNCSPIYYYKPSATSSLPSLLPPSSSSSSSSLLSLPSQMQ